MSIDSLHSLPMDPRDQREDVELLENIFPHEEHNVFGTTVSQLIIGNKNILIAGCIFFVLTTPIAHEFIVNNIPYAKISDLSCMLMKTICFMTLLYIAVHIQKSKN